MVGHMNIEEQADVDFARRRAFLRRIGGRPSNGSYPVPAALLRRHQREARRAGRGLPRAEGRAPHRCYRLSAGERFGYRESEGLLDDSTAISIRAALHREGGAP